MFVIKNAMDKNNQKRIWKIFGLELMIVLLFLVLLVLFSPKLFDQIYDIKSDLNDYQSNIAQIDPNNATAEELAFFNENLVKINDLNESINSFELTLFVFFGIFLLLSSTLSAWQSKILAKKKSYLSLLWKWVLISLGLLLFSIIYFWLSSLIVSKLGLSGNTVTWIVFWLFLFLFILKYIASFVWITKSLKLKELRKLMFKHHYKFVLVLVLYIIVLNFLSKQVILSYNYFLLPFLMLYLLLGSYIISYEKVFLISSA